MNSFDYRLVFLLLTLPQLLEWVRMPAHPLSVLASGTLAGVLLLLWVGSLSHWLHLWDELASWGVAGLLAAVVAATIPPMTVIRRSRFRQICDSANGALERVGAVTSNRARRQRAFQPG